MVTGVPGFAGNDFVQSWSAGNVHEGGTSLQVRRPCERLLELHADGVATGLFDLILLC